MELFEIPVADGDMSKEEAAAEIARFERDAHNAFCAGKTHPYNVREHPQHQAYLDYREKLFRAAYPRTDDEDNFCIRTLGGPEENYAERTARKSAEGEAAQDELREAAESELDALEELGFNRDELPEKVEEFHVRGLREQRLHAEGNYAELGTMLEADLSSLERSGGMPAGKINAVRELIRTEGVDPALKNQVDAIARDIITLIYQAKKQGVRK